MKLEEILSSKEIKLIFMQYPLRPINQIRNIFGNNSHLIFVDNEKIFRTALGTIQFNKLFKDNCGGDTGHCTEMGNELLVSNLVVAISNLFSRSSGDVETNRIIRR